MGSQIRRISPFEKAVCKVTFDDQLEKCANGFYAKLGKMLGIMLNHHILTDIDKAKNGKATFLYKMKDKDEVKIKLNPDTFFLSEKDLGFSFVAIHEGDK